MTHRFATLGPVFAAGVLVATQVTSSAPRGLAMALWLFALLGVLAWSGPRALALRGMSILVIVFLAGGLRATFDRRDAPAFLPSGASRRQDTAASGRDSGELSQPVASGQARSSYQASAHGGGEVDDRVRDEITGIVRGPVEDRHGRRHFTLCGARPLAQASEPSEARETDTACIDVAATGAKILPGDRVHASGYLSTVRGYRVPGAVDAAARSRDQARASGLTLRSAEIESIEPAAQPSLWRHAAIAQQHTSAMIAARGGDEHGNALVRAMATGDLQALDRDTEERFRIAGIAHVLSVSGLHLAVVALFTFLAVRRLWAAIPGLALRIAPALAAAVVASPVALAFTLMTGAKIPTLRALLVVLVVLFAAASARRARVVDTLGFAALLLLLHHPASLYDPSFQLSFAATVTLALAIQPRPRAPGLMRRLFAITSGLARASAWATLATVPFTALGFGQIALAGLASNLVAVPLTELAIVPLGVLGCAVAFFWPGAGGLLIDVAVLCAAGLDRLAAACAATVPEIAVFPPNRWELAGAFAIWAGALCAARRVLSRRLAFALIAGGVLLIIGSYWLTTRWLPARRSEVAIAFLDVGQGDAAVIQLPGGATWMIDGGGLPFVAPELDPVTQRRLAESPGVYSVARFLAHQRIARIDRLIISHPHSDHYEGLRAVARSVPIVEAWVARDYPHTPSSYDELLAGLDARGTRIVHPRLDQPYRHHGVALTVLAPGYRVVAGGPLEEEDELATADPLSGANDNSLVVRLEFAGRSVLFAGDLEREGEELTIARYAGWPGAANPLRADLIKVPHHGSPTSSIAAWVDATRPRWAVISCGVANRFGFPAAEVVARWQRAGTQVVRIDQLGTITAVIARDGTLGVWSHDPPDSIDPTGLRSRHNSRP